MGIIRADENWQSASRGDALDLVTLQQSGDGQRSWDVEFDGLTYDAAQRIEIAKNATGIPTYWQIWPGSPFVFVTAKNARFKGGPTVVEVVVTYTSIADPLAQTPVIEWTFGNEAGEFQEDKDGLVIANSAGEPFDPGLNREYHDLILRVSRNEETYLPTQASIYRGAVNADTFNSFDPGQVKCMVYSARPARVGAQEYFAVTYEFQMRTAESDPLNIGWLRRLQDMGYRTKDAQGVVTVITDDDGKALSEPTPLDGSGAVLAEGDDPVFLEFRDYDLLPFNILGLG